MRLPTENSEEPWISTNLAAAFFMPRSSAAGCAAAVSLYYNSIQTIYLLCSTQQSKGKIQILGNGILIKKIITE